MKFSQFLKEDMPLKGHEYHTKSDVELRGIQKDASEAAKAMKGHDSKAEAKYLDQVNDASTILYYRQQKGGKQLPKSTVVKESVDKKDLLSKLKSALLMGQPAGSAKISGRDIQEEDNSLGIRYWGKWEMPEGEEDDGDYDWEVLSAASSKKLKEVITAFEKANKCKVDCQTSEKNWIECSIK